MGNPIHIGITASKFTYSKWSSEFAFNLLQVSTLANLLCQLFIKYACKQTNPWGSNWKVFAEFIEACLLFICLILVYSLLLRCWCDSLEHFYFIFFSAFCSASQKHREEYIATVAEDIIFLCFVSRKTELWISWRCEVWAALCFLPFQALIWDPWIL